MKASLSIIVVLLATTQNCLCAERERERENNQIDSMRSEITSPEEKTIGLGEVVITPSRVKRYDDRDELFLSSSNRLFGTSSIDAISSMPEFQTTVNGSSITTATGEAVTLLIDGKKASFEELRSYPVEYIKKVIYYSTPPAKYAIYGNRPVIDVVMRRSLRGFYSIRYCGEASTAFRTAHLGSFMMADSLSVFRAWLNGSGSAINGLRISEINVIKNRVETLDGESGKSRLFTLAPGMSYQRYVGKSRWDISCNFDYEKNSSEYDQTLNMRIDGEASASGMAGSNSRFRGSGVSLDAYYEYKHDDYRQLVVNVVNTFYHNNNQTENWRKSASPLIQKYYLPNHFRNNTYSLIAEASYSNPLWGGFISPGVRFMYKTLNRLDREIGTTSNIHTKTYEADLAFSRSLGNSWYGSASIKAYFFDNQKPDGTRLTQFTPDYALNIDFAPNRYFRLSFGSVARNIAPSTNDLVGTRTYLSDYYSRLGNTNLKSQHLIAFNLTPRYNAPSGKFSCAGTLSLLYVPDSWSSCLYFENEQSVVNQLRHVAASYRYSANFMCKWMPKQEIIVEPFIQCQLHKYRTLNAQVEGWSPYVHLKFIYNSYPFTLYTVGSYTGREYNGGNGYIDGFISAAASASWSWHHITVLLMYQYAQQGRAGISEIPGYKNEGWSISPSLRHTLTLQFVYRFSKGCERKTEQKILNNTDSDKGI